MLINFNNGVFPETVKLLSDPNIGRASISKILRRRCINYIEYAPSTITKRMTAMMT